MNNISQSTIAEHVGSSLLTPSTRRIALSNTFQIISSSIASLFISAFIWKVSHSLFFVCVYNLGSYLMHPVAFYLNSYVLKRIGLKNAYIMGALLAGLTIINVAFWPEYNGWVLFLCGGCYGLGSGLYWSNRNYLEFIETRGTNRQYFYGLIYAIGWIADIVIPLICGWFIFLLNRVASAQGHIAYLILFGISFLLMIASGYLIYRAKLNSNKLTRGLLPFKYGLNKRRAISISVGVCEGIGFIAPLLTLYYFKSEAVLGSFISLSALATALAMYLYGVYNVKQYNFNGLVVSATLFTTCALLIALSHSQLSVTIFVIFSDIFVSFFGLIAQPIIFYFSELEDLSSNLEHGYSFIIDNELFLNIGRIISVVFILAIGLSFSDRMALLYCPVIIGLIQVGIAASINWRTDAINIK